MEEVAGQIALSGNLDRQAVEALQLELRRLARRHGIALKNMRVESADDSEPARGV